jgi:DnaJ-class molecular chaperone
MNFCHFLSLSQTVTKKDIERDYLITAKELHPDRNILNNLLNSIKDILMLKFKIKIDML